MTLGLFLELTTPRLGVARQAPRLSQPSSPGPCHSRFISRPFVPEHLKQIQTARDFTRTCFSVAPGTEVSESPSCNHNATLAPEVHKSILVYSPVCEQRALMVKNVFSQLVCSNPEAARPVCCICLACFFAPTFCQLLVKKKIVLVFRILLGLQKNGEDSAVSTDPPLTAPITNSRHYRGTFVPITEPTLTHY